MQNLTVREMNKDDILNIINYFYSATDEFVFGMGAIKSKLPKKEDWYKSILEQYNLNYSKKKNYYVIWEFDNEAIGHCNINQIEYQKKAFMHLHLWNTVTRKKGLGATFVKKSLPFFFNNFELEKLFCEPNAENISPNKTLPKIGFEFVKKHETIPGQINFLQEVNQYKLSRKKFLKLYG